MKRKISQIAVMTTGGDAPGMNAAIRAVVRTAIYHGLKVFGVERGYAGLINGCFRPMDLRAVSGIINRGGTILHTVRSPEFKTKSGQAKAVANLKSRGIDAAVVIGGNGSLCGARALHNAGILSMAIPATIDNDILGTDTTIGFDTAVNTAMEAIDKIRDTGFSHERVFVVEVMGRESGFIALEVGIASGAEMVLIPERVCSSGRICRELGLGRKRGKLSSIIVMAEGAGNPFKLAGHIRKHVGMEVRVSVIGHMQRGGTPTATSRLLAARFGCASVEALVKGNTGKAVGIRNGSLVFNNLNAVAGKTKRIDLNDYRLIKFLER